MPLEKDDSRHPTAVMAGLDPATQQTAPRMSAVLSRPILRTIAVVELERRDGWPGQARP